LIVSSKPQLDCHLVEAEALFQYELEPVREGQVEQAGDHGVGHDQPDLVRHARPRQVQQRRRQRLQSAQQREADQHQAAPGRVHEAEAGLGHRVVGRLLVRGERDLAGEFGRHLFTVAHDVADVPAGQPVSQHHGQHEKNDEQNRKRE
jgi:hypothetical protein